MSAHAAFLRSVKNWLCRSLKRGPWPPPAHTAALVSELAADYAQFIRDLHDAVLIIDLAGTVQALNPAVERISGQPAAALLGQPIAGFVHPADRAYLLAELARLRTTGSMTPQFEIRTISPGRSPDDMLWMEVTASITRRDGQPHRVTLLARNITSRRRAEAALRESEERYRLISETMSDYVGSVINVHGEPLRWEWVTDSITAITGFDPRDMGRYGRQFWYHPDDYPRVLADWERVQQGETVEGEYRVPTKEGGYKWLRLTRRPVITADGRQRVYVMGRDITEHKMAEARRVELAVERERFGTISQIIRAVSHDFRTGLAVIETNRYLVERMVGALLPPEKRASFDHRMKVIHDSVQHIVTQLDNMRVVAAAAAPNRESVMLTDLAADWVTQYQAQAAAHGITLTADTAPDLLPVEADATELGRALRHLLDNALAHTPLGGTITVRTYAKDGAICLEVRDTGCGIAPEHQPYLFDPFYKADAARTSSKGGVGFGLTIVRVVTEMFHGRVTLHSAVGFGTVVTLCFPAHSPASV